MTMIVSRPQHESTPPGVLPASHSPASRAAALERLLRQSVRQGVMRALLAHHTLAFTELRDLLKITDGNLSVHARKLETAGAVTCTKGFRGRFPRTEYHMTPAGRAMIEEFLAAEAARYPL
jgi:DNA-binding MarR family transcriptional regulator